ncbi:MAG: ATP-binding protein [Candidatus Competibacterales bacterium]
MVAISPLALVPAGDGARRRLATTVDRTLAFVRSNGRHRRAPLQHVLLAGPPGAGKSVALQLIAEGIKSLQSQSPLIVPFSEIDSAIIAPEVLLRRPTEMLEGVCPTKQHYPWRGGGDREWQSSLEALNRALTSDDQKAGRLIVLLVDGFDLLLARGAADDAAQSRIRDLLQNHDHVMIVASARSTNTQNDPDRRIFQAFAPIQLPKIHYSSFMAELGDLKVTSRAHGGAAAILFVDSPEHAWSLARIVRIAPHLSARSHFHALIDIQSESLLRTLDMLPLRARQFINALIRGGEPARPTEIAERLETKNSDIGQITKELLISNLIALHPQSTTRRRLYFCRDRLLADCYRRASGTHGVDLTDVFAVISEYILWLSGKPSEIWIHVAADLARIRSTLDEKGRVAAYLMAAATITSLTRPIDTYLDAMTAQLVKTPLGDVSLTGDLADFVDATTGRQTHGALLKAATSKGATSGEGYRAIIAIDLEPGLEFIREANI